MQIVSSGDNLHDTVCQFPFFFGKNKKNIINLLSVYLACKTLAISNKKGP